MSPSDLGDWFHYSVRPDPAGLIAFSSSQVHRRLNQCTASDPEGVGTVENQAQERGGNYAGFVKAVHTRRCDGRTVAALFTGVSVQFRRCRTTRSGCGSPALTPSDLGHTSLQKLN